MFLLMITLMMFGMPLIMLSYNAVDESKVLIDDILSFWFLNMLIN